MKRVFLIILFAITTALPASAQHFVGVRGGWGLGYGRFAPISWYTMKPVWGMFSGGFQWKYYGRVRYIGAIGAEVEFLQRAYQLQAGLESEDYTRRVYNSVNVPLIWHIHYNFHNNSLRVFLNAGVWASYNISAKQWIKIGEVVEQSPYNMRLVRDNPLGYGLLGGLGMNVIMGKWELMIEARYYFSYGDILRNNAVYAGNPVRSPLDNISVSLGFFYRIGSRPHIPLPPSAWNLPEQQQIDSLKDQNVSEESVAMPEQETDVNTESSGEESVGDAGVPDIPATDDEDTPATDDDEIPVPEQEFQEQ